MRILIIDNYDSFTFNLYQYIGEILESVNRSFDLRVKRNDEISLSQIKRLNPHRIIISPGPGSPAEPNYFGVCAKVLTEIGKTIPVLGICLGMQGLAYCYGGKIIRAKVPMHGKTSIIWHNKRGIFRGLPQDLEVMRYHSLIVESDSLPNCLEVTAVTKDKERIIMGLKHKRYPLQGVQFHPESFATEGGKVLLKNFLFQKNK